MKRLPSLIVATGLALCANAVGAVETPHAGKADPRMKTVDYDPAQVVRVVGAFRTATEIMLAPDETISHVALGDSSAWDIAAEKNILFLKPKERRGLTNLLVTSVKGDETRTYTFELATREGSDARRGAATYFQLRFRYPADARAQLIGAISVQEAALHQKMVQYKLERGVLEGTRNTAYSAQGSNALSPSEVSDNGRFTVLRFPAAQPIPAIYTVAPDGAETLAPFDVRGEFVVLHEVAKEIRLRRGREVACLWNDAYAPYGAITGTRTAASDVERTDKEHLAP